MRAHAVAVNLGNLKIRVQGTIYTGDTLGMQLNRKWLKHDDQSCTRPVCVIRRAVFDEGGGYLEGRTSGWLPELLACSNGLKATLGNLYSRLPAPGT